MTQPDFGPMADPSDRAAVVCLTLGDGGTRAQALGLAEALARRFDALLEERRFAFRRWSRRLSARAWHGAARVVPGWPELGLAEGARVMAPLPTGGPAIVLGAGRHAAPLVAALSRRTAAAAVMILDPELPHALFDAVILPAHDGVTGPSVLTTLGSLGRVTQENITEAAGVQAARFAHLPGPRLAVLLGGPAREFTWTGADTGRLVASLAAVQGAGWSLLVTPSPRSDPAVIAQLRAALSASGCWIWDGQGTNPYPALLGLADAVLVTEDSVNMVSEAATSGLPVHAFRLTGRVAKMDRFYQAIEAQGAVRGFQGTIGRWSYPPLDETARIAAILGSRHLR
ncbi:mitochondrial fission ELM1 family protein [Salipiger sp. H15]|uniref:Mitochondrial fission ELM1 family protein n=1 Tax=Alloyangia sp. H15 TaxID=3029062 RepID=A0AAU8ANJ7_9RHOB